MPQPASYPNTDQAENRAVSIFRSLINDNFVKDDIKTRDKHPNTDGTIELTNDNNRPIGKFDVQIRAFKSDKMTYGRCPTSLVAYSKVSTLPVIIICVDTQKKLAFWKHIYPEMPEYKKEQKTFTIYFSESDSIDKSGIYIDKWVEIVSDYQKRISNFPTLQFEIANKLSLENIDSNEIAVYQMFIDKINYLLDNDFSCIKNRVFPKVWKLGVGILPSTVTDAWDWYQIYRIPYGQPVPLVSKLNSWMRENNNNNAVYERGGKTITLSNYQTEALNFVSGKIESIVKQRALPLFGVRLQSDLLFSFVDDYYRCLGLERGLNYFDLKTLLGRGLPNAL